MPTSLTISRRLLAVLTAWLALAAPTLALDLNIGYQKSAVNLASLKAQGVLEQKLKPLGVEVKWFEFQAGPPILEAMNAGSISVGMTAILRQFLPSRLAPRLCISARSRPNRNLRRFWCPPSQPLKPWRI